MKITTNHIYQLGSPKVSLASDFQRAVDIAKPAKPKLYTGTAHKEELKACGVDKGRLSLIKRHSRQSVTVEGKTNNLFYTDLRKHPKPAKDFGVSSMSSYLNRHFLQLSEFRTHVLPLIVRRKMDLGNKALNIAVIGSGFDEAASISSAVAQEFDLHSEWEDIGSWKSHVDSFEVNLPVLFEAIERSNGRSPLSNYKHSAAKAHDQDLTISALNKNPSWYASRMTGFYSDATQKEVIDFMKLMGYDVVCMNATFLDLDALSAKRLASSYSEMGGFFLGDSLQDCPIMHMKDSHLVEHRISEARHANDYAIAVPKTYQDEWEINATRRKLVRVEESLAEKPRLKLLLITDSPENDTEFWLRENLGCWSKHHGLNNTEITVTGSNIGRIIKNKISNKYFNLVFLDSNDFKRLQHHTISSYTFFEVAKYNYGQPIFIVSNEPIEVQSYESIIVLTKEDIISEDKLTGYIEPIAKEQGLISTLEGKNKPRLSEELAGLYIFAEAGPLYRIDSLLISDYHLEQLHKLLLPYLSDKPIPKKKSTLFDSWDKGALEKLEKDKPALTPNVPPYLRAAWESFFATLLRNIKPAIECVSDDVDTKPGWSLAYNLRELAREISLLSRVSMEFDICLESDPDDLKAFLGIYWGGCGYVKPRCVVIKERLLADNKYALDKINGFVYKSVSEKRNRLKLATTFNELVDAIKKLRLEIQEKMKLILSKYEKNFGEIVVGDDKTKTC